MEQNFNDIVNSISNIEPPKHLRQAIFVRLEKEKAKSIARKLLFLRIGFVLSGISSFATVAIFGKEVLSSEFFSIVALAFSDIKIISAIWQDYACSLLETVPMASIVATLLPIFIFMLLLREYGKLESGQLKISRMSFRP